jgi:hypothetical protein
MLPVVHGAAGAYAAQKAEEERRRRQEEEEVMTGYSHDDLAGDWQFKIVKGTFKKRSQVEAVIQEQAEFGWIMVEIFDHNRIRFKRPASEVAKDEYRERNPYQTVSKAAGPGCGSMVLLAVVLSGGTLYWLL